MRSKKRVRLYEAYEKKTTIKELVATYQRELNDKRANKSSPRVIQNLEAKINNIIAGNPTTNKEKALFEPINFSSPTQLKELFFYSKKGFKFDVVKYTKGKDKKPTDNASTDEETLLKLKKEDKSGFVKLLLDHRGLSTLHGTFVKGMLERQVEGKIYANFLLHGTVTGRLCIGENTEIVTDKGLIKIGDIIPNKEGIIEIEGINALTHTGEYKPITHAINKGYEDMYLVELENGQSIECTLEHRFLTPKGWYSLREINNTDCAIMKTLITHEKE